MAREFAKKFYKSKAWQDTRNYIYTKANGICEICGEIGQEVHHKTFLTPNNINDPNIALGEDNLILLCKDCHAKKHSRFEPTTDGLVFNKYGELIRDGE